MGINSVHFSGNVGKQPEIKYFESGSVKVDFSLAVQNYEKGDYVTMWVNCEAWGKMAEFIGEKVNKGHNITIAGKLTEQKWKSEAGENRSRLVVIISDIQPQKYGGFENGDK